MKSIKKNKNQSVREAVCIQHSRAALALTAAIGFRRRLLPPPELEALASDIDQAIDECAKQTRKKRLSKGAERDIAAACEELGPWLEEYDRLDPDIRFFRFSVVGWCALTLVEDVCNICPAIWTGAANTGWQRLRKSLADLCAGLETLEADCAIAGSDLYECCVDALTGKVDEIPIKNLQYAFTHHKAA